MIVEGALLLSPRPQILLSDASPALPRASGGLHRSREDWNRYPQGTVRGKGFRRVEGPGGNSPFPSDDERGSSLISRSSDSSPPSPEPPEALTGQVKIGIAMPGELWKGKGSRAFPVLVGKQPPPAAMEGAGHGSVSSTNRSSL